jgi:hypothetical protein
MTERTLGAKAGHLELLKGGKKNKDYKDAKSKGGSKKFGWEADSIAVMDIAKMLDGVPQARNTS